MDLHLDVHLAQVLHPVVGERIVVVDDQDHSLVNQVASGVRSVNCAPVPPEEGSPLAIVMGGSTSTFSTRSSGTGCPKETWPILFTSTNLTMPSLTFLSCCIVSKSFSRCAGFNWMWVGSPAFSNRPAIRSTSRCGKPSNSAESRAANTWPMEMASPWRNLP